MVLGAWPSNERVAGGSPCGHVPRASPGIHTHVTHTGGHSEELGAMPSPTASLYRQDERSGGLTSDQALVSMPRTAKLQAGAQRGPCRRAGCAGSMDCSKGSFPLVLEDAAEPTVLGTATAERIGILFSNVAQESKKRLFPFSK